MIPARRPPYRYKHPDETRVLTFDFSKKLLGNAQITGEATFTSDQGVTVSSGLVAHPTVTCLVGGGVLGQKYSISCRMSATNGEVLALTVLLGIENAN